MESVRFAAVAVGVIACACGRIGFAPGGLDGESDAAAATDDGVTSPSVCGNTILMSDLFTASTPNARWTVMQSAGITTSQGGGKMAIQFGATASAPETAGYTLASPIDLTDTCTVVEMTRVPDPAMSTIVVIQVGIGNPDLRFEWLSGNLRAIYQMTSNSINHIDIRPYDAVAHRFLRLRNVGGSSWYWEASGDGAMFAMLASYTTSTVSPTNVLTVRAGAVNTVTNAGSCDVAQITISK